MIKDLKKYLSDNNVPDGDCNEIIATLMPLNQFNDWAIKKLTCTETQLQDMIKIWIDSKEPEMISYLQSLPKNVQSNISLLQEKVAIKVGHIYCEYAASIGYPQELLSDLDLAVIQWSLLGNNA